MLFKSTSGRLLSSYLRCRCGPSVTARSASSFEQVDEDVPPWQLPEEAEYELARDLLRIPGTSQQLFLIQPRIKIGPNRNYLTTPQLQLEENKTLVETLGWKIVDHIILPVSSYDSTHVFGRGNFEKLQEAVRSCRTSASAIFFGSNTLKKKQLAFYRETFGMPVFDRYRIVLEIFRAHAKTKEAKLQVALAELPYFRALLGGIGEVPGSSIQMAGSGSGQTRDLQRQIMRDREGKLRTALDKIRSNRAVLRRGRKKNEINSVAVVGYTNCGKTSLIKALTGDVTMKPENKLFATLDVTSHGGRLPNSVSVLYVDTIGFISDIPTSLIASFAAVLEEIGEADVLVHVRDVSHPDTKSQKETVLKQLRELALPEKLLNSMIEVCNKVDMLPEIEKSPEKVSAADNAIFTSATANTGLYSLRERIEAVLLGNTGLTEKQIRVPQGGAELSWLYREAHVHFLEADVTDSQFLVAHVTISPSSFARYIHQFRKIQVLTR
ncbi:hypothetical protein RvY_13855 [Ramazzottius varieornatus]|uniref:Hflx-type G domain-containing protein n=1 Tax=Ramazzottius varieornatus TaxID=947166 RepID=A0A1D1VPB7_RAMVA|nr:hypothetical protein RvY_13855 [Ramazzottius varieornatus]